MKYKSYSPEVWKRLEAAVDKAFKAGNGTPVAAFDADGTLWDTDLGEAFFHYKIDRKLVPLPQDPWNYYVELKKKNGDPREAYLWLAQILNGTPLAKVREWARAAVEENKPTPVFPEQKKLIEFLLERGVDVFIVTASIRWAVEAGAPLLGLTSDHVIGIETAVENDVVTDRAHGIITHRQGKPEALLKRTGGRRPFLAAGNTMGDLELIESSTDIKLAVSAAARDDRLFKTENELQQLAMSRGWIAHRFVPDSDEA